MKKPSVWPVEPMNVSEAPSEPQIPRRSAEASTRGELRVRSVGAASPWGGPARGFPACLRMAGCGCDDRPRFEGKCPADDSHAD